MKRTLIIASIFSLAACTSIDLSNRVDGWPVLQEELHVVSVAEMHNHCDKYSGVGMTAFSCAEIFWNPPTCKIWLTEAGGWTEEHERQHCLGYDHPGSNGMRDMLARRNKE